MKDFFYIALPILFILDIIFRFIIYKADKRLNKANKIIQNEINKSLALFENIQTFIISKIGEDNEKI